MQITAVFSDWIKNNWIHVKNISKKIVVCGVTKKETCRFPKIIFLASPSPPAPVDMGRHYTFPLPCKVKSSQIDMANPVL